MNKKTKPTRFVSEGLSDMFELTKGVAVNKMVKPLIVRKPGVLKAIPYEKDTPAYNES